LAILVATQLGMAVPDGDPGRLITATATLTALTGVLLIAASVLRLGFVANFISAPVLTGFKAGIGLVIVLDQVPKLLGIHIAKEGFFRDVLNLVRDLPETSLVTLGIGGVALVLLLILERLRPHSPAPLAIVAAGIAVSWLAGLDAAGVATVGHIPQALPSMTMPDLDLAMQLLPGAMGIALMSFTETIAAGRAFARPSEPRIRPDRELLATGAANLSGAFFGAMPAGGGTSQSAVVRAVGGQSQKASLVTAAASAATMLVLAPLLGLLPQAVLAAIVIVYSVGLIQPLEFATIRKVRTMEFRWALAAFLGVLVFGTLQGILVAIILSLLGLASQAAHPRVHVIGRKRGEDVLRPLSPENPDDETFEGLLIVRPEGRLFFANAQQVSDRVRALVVEHKPRVLLLDLSRVFDIEYSALQMMMEGERRYTEEGITVWLAVLNPDVLRYITASGFADRLGKHRLFPNARAAIRRHLDGSAPVTRGAGVEAAPPAPSSPPH
jgi:MFS superfamily sulfate permease-like transporter